MTRVLVAIVLLAASLGMMLWCRAPGTPAPGLPPESQLPSAAPPMELFRESVPTLCLPVLIQDELTGKPLELTVRLRLPGERVVVIESGSQHDLSHAETAAWLEYPIDGKPFRCAAEGRIRLQDESWLLSLPYFCCVQVEMELVARPAPGQALAGIFEMPPERAMTDEVAETGGGPFDFGSSSATFHGMMNRHLRESGAKPLVHVAWGAESFPPICAPLLGEYCASVILKDGTKGYCPLVAVPGERQTVRIGINPRPCIRGRLVDWEDAPVADGIVQCSIALDLEDYDFGSGDGGFGLAVIRSGGVLHHVAKRTFRTDSDGYFSLTVPRGTGFALESHAKGGYVFWQARDFDAVARIADPITLQLQDPDQMEPIRFTITVEGQGAIMGAEVIPSLASDLPFIRQFPRYCTDDTGAILVHGMQPGMLAGVSVFHASLRTGHWGSKSIVIPTTRDVQFIVPISALERELSPQ